MLLVPPERRAGVLPPGAARFCHAQRAFAAAQARARRVGGPLVGPRAGLAWPEKAVSHLRWGEERRGKGQAGAEAGKEEAV